MEVGFHPPAPGFDREAFPMVAGVFHRDRVRSPGEPLLAGTVNSGSVRIADRGRFGSCWGMGFDRLAPHYRWIEAWFAGDRLQRCRVALLDELPAPRNVLVFGEGNGRFLTELLRRFPNARVTVVEASGVMIDLARSRLRREGLDSAAVAFVQADALGWDPPTSFSPASGPVTGSFNGLHRESNFLGASQSPERRGWRS